MYDNIYMLSIRLDPEIENRLERISKKSGRSKSYYARLAIEEKLDDLEDIAIAIERLESPGDTISLEKLAEELGIELEG